LYTRGGKAGNRLLEELVRSRSILVARLAEPRGRRGLFKRPLDNLGIIAGAVRAEPGSL